MSSNCKHPTCFDSPVCRRSPNKNINTGRVFYQPPKKAKITAIPEKEQNEWFLERAKECTGICCNCGGASPIGDGRFWKFAIAHIFPKSENSGFPSVACHPDNWMELCIECHTLYDRSLHVAHTLKCWRLAVIKFIKFKDRIVEKHKRFYVLFCDYVEENQQNIIRDEPETLRED